MESVDSFYLVYCMDDGVVSDIFDTREEASEYAKHMASKNIGYRYFIMFPSYGYGVVNPEPQFIMVNTTVKQGE